MALVLGMAIGDIVDIATHSVSLQSVDDRHSATLVDHNGREITISADEMTEFVPDVWLGLGPDNATYRLRLLVDAPRHILVNRRHA
jgi:hypothetical protein